MLVLVGAVFVKSILNFLQYINTVSIEGWFKAIFLYNSLNVVWYSNFPKYLADIFLILNSKVSTAQRITSISSFELNFLV